MATELLVQFVPGEEQYDYLEADCFDWTSEPAPVYTRQETAAQWKNIGEETVFYSASPSSLLAALHVDPDGDDCWQIVITESGYLEARHRNSVHELDWC